MKKRWNLKSTWQIVVVLLVFACTGFTVLFMKPLLMRLFFEDKKPTTMVYVLYYVMLPIAYNLLLLMYGFLFGQATFFWNFEKKTFMRLASLLKFQKKS